MNNMLKIIEFHQQIGYNLITICWWNISVFYEC
nr:MAG TPA: hypothetical protein [Caudoviricetes sp.]